MGRRKFRLSDMIPNAWFYKLRDMRAGGRDRGVTRQPSSSSSRGNGVVQRPATPRNASAAHAFPQRASYYYTSRGKELPPPSVPTDERLLPPLQSPPRNSRRRHKVRPFKPGPELAAGELVSAPRGRKPVAEAAGGSSQRRRDMYIVCDGGELRVPTVTFPADEGLTGKVIASEKDIVIDLRAEDAPAERVLRPILTRPVRRQADPYELEDGHVELADTTAKDSPASSEKSSRPRRSASSSGRRLKTRANSPRLAAVKGRPASSPARRSARFAPAPAIADSFAVVKTSRDPRKDFLESMEEMIAEKDIRTASDLEDLLACYLSLNAAEHHDIIVEVFEEIWTGAANVNLSI